jgi:hypothetical protein
MRDSFFIGFSRSGGTDFKTFIELNAVDIDDRTTVHFGLLEGPGTFTGGGRANNEYTFLIVS